MRWVHQVLMGYYVNLLAHCIDMNLILFITYFNSLCVHAILLKNPPDYYLLFQFRMHAKLTFETDHKKTKQISCNAQICAYKAFISF